MKAADLDDRAVLRAAVADARDRHVESLGACTWTLAANYFPDAPGKVVAAKLRKLALRGLLTGCPCGCRGDWLLTDDGAALAAEHTQPEAAP